MAMPEESGECETPEEQAGPLGFLAPKAGVASLGDGRWLCTATEDGATSTEGGAQPLRAGAQPLRAGAQPLKAGLQPLRAGTATEGGGTATEGGHSR